MDMSSEKRMMTMGLRQKKVRVPRRMLNKTETITGLVAKDIMTAHPKTIKSTDMVVDALNILEDFSITQLVVVDNGEYKGVIHLHDILKEGIV